MTIKTAQRFKFLDLETNSPIEKFEDIKDSFIRNLESGNFKEISETLQRLMDTAEGIAGDIMKQIEESGPIKALKEITRETKGLFDKVMALTGLDDRLLDKFLDDISSDFQTKKTVKHLIQSCRTATGGMGNVGKPFKSTTACASGNKRPLKSDCGSEEFAGHLEKLTNGTFKNTVQTPNKQLRKLVTIAGTGYNLGLCGAYNAVGQGMDKRVRAKGAAGLLSMTNKGRNSVGTMDIAKGSVGLQPKNYYPGVVSDFLSDFQAPLGTLEKNWSKLGQSVTATAELLDKKWNVSDYDGSPSLKNMGSFSRDLGNAFDSVRTGMSFASSQLNDVVNKADNFVTGAYSMANKVNNTINKVSSFGKKLSKWF